MNCDVNYAVSVEALTALYDEAGRLSVPIGTAFRRKAYALTRASKPRFRLSGGNLGRTFTAGVHPGVYTGLVRLAERLGVPVACIAELVATFDMESQ